MELEESTCLTLGYTTKLCCLQDNMVLAQREKHRSMEQNRKTRDKFMYLWTTNPHKGCKIYNGEKTISLTSGAGKTGQSLVKELN